MIKKLFTVLYNGIRFAGRKQYKNLLLVSPSACITKGKRAVLSIGKKFRARRQVEINVRDEAEVTIGDNVFFNSGCVLTARKRVSIGSNTIFGPQVMIFDNDHAVKDGVVCDNVFTAEEITIGSHVWIGAGTIILKGSVIEDHCIIAAGSIVKGRVESGRILVQKRETSFYPLGGE